MIRVILNNETHTVDLRTDAGFNPEVIDTLVRQALDAITTAALLERGNDAEVHE